MVSGADNQVHGDSPALSDLLTRMRMHIALVFCLNTREEEIIWQYVIGVAAQLEHLGVGVLWVYEGRPGQWEDFEDRLTLGAVARRLAKQHVLQPETIARMCAVAALRNRVAHRTAMSGVPMAGDYKGRNVFRDVDARGELVGDAGQTIEELDAWLRQNAPDLYPDAGGAA